MVSDIASLSAYEILRQRTILESAPDPDVATVPQETRGFDEHRFETYRLRTKENVPDYRYMPDPNLGILVLSQVISHCRTHSVSNTFSPIIGPNSLGLGNSSGASLGYAQAPSGEIWAL